MRIANNVVKNGQKCLNYLRDNVKKPPSLFIGAGILLLVCCGGGEEQAGPAVSPWLEDIAWIQDSLPELHYDLFMYVPRDSLIARLDRLRSDLDSMTDMEIVMKLTEILAAQRCSHTGIAFWENCDMRVYPLSIMWLNTGLYVTMIHRDHEELLGSRLLSYDGRPGEEAAAAISRLFPAVNSVQPRTRAENLMMLAGCMEVLGYGSSTEEVPFQFLTAGGDTVEVDFTAGDMDYSAMVDFHNSGSLPIWLNSDACYWYRYLPQYDALYYAYNSCSLMEDYGIEELVEDMDDELEDKDIRHVIVDLRRNSGGNSLLAYPVIQWLGEVSAQGRAEVSLIIGRWTYSSGILNALDIAAIPGVTVYGDSTGGAPNHLGEVRSAALPFSGLPVSYPTKYFQAVEGEGRTMVPDVVVPLDPGMLFSGENRIIELIVDE